MIIDKYKNFFYIKTKPQAQKNISSLTSKKSLVFFSSILVINSLFSTTFTSVATDLPEETGTENSSPVQSQSYRNWPAGPAISAEAAILIDANTGTILYEKNIHDEHAPASTTKILTALIASETCELDEMVHFSHEAVFNLEYGTSNMGMDENEALPMEEALYGILVASANETANAVAEHIGGTNEGFSKIMNEKAESLGAYNSNFSNPHGLYEEDHYTTAYDLSLIAREFFKNDLLCKMSSTRFYQIPQSPTQPDDDCYIDSSNKLFENQPYEYEYLVGSKTGYTDLARQTLVSAASKGGLKLICVILKAESPSQFTDTIALFDYGFSNFQPVSIAENEVKYSLEGSDSFSSEIDIFGNSTPVFSLNEEAYVVIPTTADFSDLQSTLDYDVESDSSIARINYTYYDTPVGRATIDFHIDNTNSLEFEETPVADSSQPQATSMDAPIAEETENVIFINVVKVLMWTILIVAIIILFIYLRALINSYHFNKRRRARIARRKKSVIRGEFDDFDFEK